MAVKCDPDSIYIDGMEGGTGAGPHLATEETGVPGMAAIRQARKAIDDLGKRGEVSLVYAGGCLLYTSPSPRDRQKSRMPSSA